MFSNSVIASIDTDRAISDILSNFSDDFIDDVLENSLQYKFSPFNIRMPNYPAVLEDNFRSIINNAPGYAEEITEKRQATYTNMINYICNHYNLMMTSDILDEEVYTVCYMMYDIFVANFTEKMIDFFAQYILNHITQLAAAIDEEHRVIRTGYAKKMYNGKTEIAIVYDNLDIVINIISALDISLQELLRYISDEATVMYLSKYLSDCGDIYKCHYASYLLSPATRTDMMTSIKLRFVAISGQNSKIVNQDIFKSNKKETTPNAK